jgi:HAD superfamily hydrolase (TIGR01509 family)
MSLKALIFDFDGLMVDTEQSIFDAYCDIFEEHGVQLPLRIWELIIGTTGHRDQIFVALEKMIGCPVDRDMLHERARERHHMVSSQLPAVEGLVEQIESAQKLGLNLGVASSSTLEWVAGHLGRLGLLRHFGAVCTRGDVVKVKPDPELYRLAVARLDVEPSEAIALEDSPNGITSAKAAGLFCVAIPNPLTTQMELGHADMQVSTLSALSLSDIAARME